ncbi:MAG: hypothetical protein U0637_10415 [Phycisphaerales bacterium]
MKTRVHSTSRRSVLVAALWVVGVAGVVAGCQRPLWEKDAPRSQYDRTAAIRDRRAPDYIYDEFGARRPNIRGRLLGAE